MAKSLHPRWLTLRVLASKLERGLLTPEEARATATLLRRIAAGDSIDDILGAKRAANRPHEDRTHHYVEQVYGLTQPTYDGKPGMTVTAAIDEVASTCNISISTVKTAYYSEAGRAYLEVIKDALRDRLA